jgi:hypothetical protein
VKGAGTREERNRRFVTAFVRPHGLDTPSTPRFVAAVEQLAQRRRREPDPGVSRPSLLRGAVTRLAVAGTRGLGAWLLMDSVDDERAITERARDEHKRAVLSERAARWEAERREQGEERRRSQQEREDKQRLRRAKEWRKTRKEWWRQTRHRAKQGIHLVRAWRHALATSKPVVRLKNGVKLLTGARSR